ncbi:hypothetical protein BDF14DRAFT_965243 [Spinellus fusiger]|nr:hypothetical protein BDF14DRAFT_965243 [Spinellus fusiger]
MSGFFGSTDGTRWGGLLKQAISNVETTFDSLREQNDTSLKQGHYDSDTMETETFIDPMTGAVTTMQRPKRPPIKNTTSMTLEKKTTARPPTTRSASSLPGSPSSDISARLAAVLQEKAATAHSPPSLPTMPEVSSLSVLPPSPALIQQETSETDLRLSSVKKSVSQDTSSTLTDTANVTDATTAATTTDATTTDVEDTTDTAVAKAVADTAVAEVISPTSPPSSSTSLEGGKILEQREKQLLQAMETIASLHDQLHQAQHSQETTQTLLNQVQVQLKAAQHSSPLTSSSSSSSLINKFTKKLESTIEELKQQMALKEEQVQGLLREGEKLSKNEFKHTTTIKKLRSEKIEVDKTVAEIQKKHEKSLLDLQEANAKITKTVEVEKRLQESIKVLSDMTEQQTKHINRLESEALLSKEQHTKTQI